MSLSAVAAWPKSRWVGAAVVLVLLALAAVWLARGRGAAVPVAQVQPADLVQSLAVSGRVASEVRVALGATVTGRVQAVTRREGGTLIAGELLVQLEDTELAASLQQAQAALATARNRLDSQRRLAGPLATQQVVQARANAEAAQRERVRYTELLAQGFIGQSKLDDVRRAADVAQSALQSALAQREANVSGTELQQAQARVAEAEAALALARARLAQTRITVPADATVLDRLVEPGQIVQPGTKLVELSVRGPLQLVALVDEKFITRLSPGQAALVTADAFEGRPFEARILTISPLVDAQRGSVEVKFSLAEQAAAAAVAASGGQASAPAAGPLPVLKNDMSVSIEIVTGRRSQALAVPGEALRPGPAVLVVEQGQAVLRPVTTGLRTLAMVEITRGLLAGEQVVLDPAVSPGARVRPVPRVAAAAPVATSGDGGAMSRGFGGN